MAKLTLSNITGGYLPIATVNANSDAIEAAIENTVSRDGTGPNHMLSNFDLNSYRIINLAAPVSNTDAATKAYVDSVVSGDATGVLLALSLVSMASDKLPYFTSTSAASTTTLTAAGRALLDDATASDQLTTLGVSSFAKTILDDADAAAVRTTLGVSTGSGDLVAANNLSDVASAITARTNLGLAIGTNVQAYNANLTAIDQALTTTSSPTFTTVSAALSGNATTSTRATNIAGGLGGQIPYQSAANTTALLANGTSGQVLQSNGTTAAPSWATITGTGDLQAANNLSDVANAATARTNLGLAIGTNVQAYDADLTTWAGVTPGTGVATAIAVNVGSAGAIVVNGGALGTPTSGTATNLTGTAASLTAGTATNLAGGSEGTIPYQSAAGTTAMLANGTAGQILQSNGTTLAPSWITAAGTGDMLKSENLSGLANYTTARSNLGLGSIATQAASAIAVTGGTATGLTNLVTSEFGSTISTGTVGTTIPNMTTFGGTWATHSIVNYTDTANHTGDARIALGAVNFALGSGTTYLGQPSSSPATSDYAGFFVTEKQSYQTTAVTGEIDGIYAVVAQGKHGDAAGILIGAEKKQGGTGGLLSLEASARLSNGTTPGLGVQYALTNHVGWLSIDSGENLGYVAEMQAGVGTCAFMADTLANFAAQGAPAPSWTYAFGVRTARATTASSWDFYITAGGIARGDSGAMATPTWSFTDDTNTGMYNPSADALGFVTGGTVRTYLDSMGKLYPAVDNTYSLGDPSFRWANIYTTTFTATSLGGTLTTAAQPNVTSVGTLTALNMGTGAPAGTINTVAVGKILATVGNGTPASTAIAGYTKIASLDGPGSFVYVPYCI